MKQLTTFDEVKLLLEMAVKNDVKVKFMDSKNTDHNEMRCHCVQYKFAMIFDDMDTSEMKKELKNALEANNINPNKENYNTLKILYKNMRLSKKGR